MLSCLSSHSQRQLAKWKMLWPHFADDLQRTARLSIRTNPKSNAVVDVAAFSCLLWWLSAAGGLLIRSNFLELHATQIVLLTVRLRTSASILLRHPGISTFVHPSQRKWRADTYSLIQSRLDYANASKSSTNFDKLQLIKTLLLVLSLLTGKDIVFHQHEHLHWIRVRHRVDYKLALVTHTIYHSSEHLRLRWQLVNYTLVRSSRSSDSHLFVASRTELACASSVFSIAEPW